jgi:hypothetical protein
MSDMADLRASSNGDDPAYSYKASLVGAAFEFRLCPDGLEWRKGRREGRAPYGRIARVRLSFRPMTMQMRRFVTEIWPADGPKLTIASTTWRSLVEQSAQDEAYGAFIRELHRRLIDQSLADQSSVAAPSQASFETGMSPFLYWPGLVLFAGASVGFLVLTVRALELGAYGGAALIGGFLVLSLWQSSVYFWRNRPGRYRPEAPPRYLVPGG